MESLDIKINVMTRLDVTSPVLFGVCHSVYMWHVFVRVYTYQMYILHSTQLIVMVH